MKYSRVFAFLSAFLICISDVKTQNTFTNRSSSKSGQVFPEKYTLRIVPFLNNFTFWGEVLIDFSVLNYTNEITLDAENLNCQRFVLRASNPKLLLDPVMVTERQKGNLLVFSRQALMGRYSLNISFSGQLSDIKEAVGFYYDSYINNETGTIYVTTKLREGEARRLFPCFDDPVLQSSFIVHIARFTNQSSLANMPLAKTSLPDSSVEGRVWDIYYDSPNLSTHQVGITVHQLTRIRLANLNTSILVTSDTLDQTSFALPVLQRALNTLQKWSRNFTFPLSKMDVLALPDGSAEKSHSPGLVTCREDHVLFKEGISNAQSKQEVFQSILNIVARQWMGLQVNTSPGSWLQDGISTFLEYKMAAQMEPSWRTSELFCVEILQEALLEDTDSVHSNVNLNMFYKKAAAILRMLESVTSEDVVKKALSNFANIKGLVTPEQLFAAVNNEVHSSVTTFPSWLVVDVLQTWTSQQGYPVINVNVTGSAVYVSQQDFLGNKTKWPLPMTYKSQQEMTPHQVWLFSSQERLVLPLDSSNGWVLFNVNQSGYYRVNYNRRNWNQLVDQLLKDHLVLSAVSRSQLIDDAFQLALAGLVNYSVAFNLSQYLTRERDYVPWVAATRNFEQLIKMIHGTQLAFDLRRYVGRLYFNYYLGLVRGSSATKGQETERAKLDALLQACHWRLQHCLDFSSELFKQWQSVSVGFPPNYKPAVLCIGVQQFPDAFLDIFDSFTQSEVEADRKVFLKALACTNSSEHLLYLMSTAFIDKHQMMISHNSKLWLFDQIISYPENVKLVLDFLVHNFNTVSDVAGKDLLDSIWFSLKENIVLESDIEMIQKLVQNTSIPLGLREGLNSSLTTVMTSQLKAMRLAPLVAAALRTVAPNIVVPVASSASQLYFGNLLIVSLVLFNI